MIKAEDAQPPVPATCAELDQQLGQADTLARFLVHGVDSVKHQIEKLDDARACASLAINSSYVSGLVGITTYCQTQSVLSSGSTTSPLYNRLKAALSTIGNELDRMARVHRC